jgi:hypothetical protein
MTPYRVASRGRSAPTIRSGSTRFRLPRLCDPSLCIGSISQRSLNWKAAFKAASSRFILSGNQIAFKKPQGRSSSACLTFRSLQPGRVVDLRDRTGNPVQSRRFDRPPRRAAISLRHFSGMTLTHLAANAASWSGGLPLPLVGPDLSQ